MKNSTITSRQYEALKAIKAFQDQIGIPPTLKELGKILRVSSDQSVLNLIKRLEEKGYLKSEKKARGLFLTGKADIVLGITIPEQRNAKQQLEPINPPLNLDSHQKMIFEKLNEIDPLLAKTYMGGLIVIKDKSNPDRIALSAHAFREIIVHLSNKGRSFIKEEEEKKWREQKVKVRARKLERYQDPRGGVSGVDETIYDVFDRLFYDKGFAPISHHGKIVSFENYNKLVAEFEQFLIYYILPKQPEIYAKIDNLIKKKPKEVDSEGLRLLITLNLESYHYFFKNVGSSWLEYLRDNNFLQPTWPAGNYLSRIAPERPQDVMDILLKYKVDPDNQEIKNTFTIAATKMEPAIAAQLVKKIQDEKWMIPDERQLFLLQHYINDFLKHLIKGQEYKAALILSYLYFDVYKKDSNSPRAQAFIDDYQYSEALQHIKLIPPEKLQPFIYMLLKRLRKVCEIESDGLYSDYSHSWLPAVEDHKQNWDTDAIGVLLIKSLRDLLKTYLDYIKTQKLSDIEKELSKLLDQKPVYPIFKRLKLYFYKLYPEIFIREISEEVSISFNDYDSWHEYSVLLRDTFDMLDKNTKKKFFSLVDQGPKEEGEADEEYIRYWKARRIMIIQQWLEPEEKKKYKDLLLLDVKDPDFMTTHHSWSGPNSPYTKEVIAALSVQELVKTLNSWISPKDKFGPAPSRRGLGLILGEVIKENPKKYIDGIDEFYDSKLHPTYIVHLFYGFKEALKTNNLNYSSVVPLTVEIIERIKTGRPQDFEMDEDNEAWESVARAIISFITSLLGQNENEYLETQKILIWSVIETLCEHPDPTPEHEEKYGGNNMDPFTMSINTVRGEAFHSLFTYMIWCNKLNQKMSGKSKKLFVPDEVKQVAERHLDTKIDSTLSIRSVFGKYLPWIILYDEDWANRIIKQILPEEDKDLRYAAWETYMVNTIFPEVYIFMQPYYETAIKELSMRLPKRRYWVDIVENLAGHVMLGMIFNIDKGKKPLYKEYFNKANAKQRGIAISFVGRSIILKDAPAHSKERKPNIKKMQNFWEWRLRENSSVDELKEFGWWVKENFFDNEWMLERLLEIVKVTCGVLEGEHWAIKTLSKLSKDFPLLCADITNLLIRAGDRHNRYLFIYEEEIQNILNNVFRSGDKDAEKIGEQALDFLTKMGFEKFRYIKGDSIPSI